MNIFERLILAVNPKAALNRAYYKQLCRSYYDAAGRTRDNWVRGNTTGELTDRAARDTVRSRARALERNDDSFKGIILDLERNVVGTGAVLQAKTKSAGGGWVLKYAFQYIISGDFGSDKQAYFTDFTTSTVEPIIWAMILLAFVSILLLFGITNLVEKVTKIIMPILFLFLIICGIWAIFVTDNAIEGLKYYLLPDFSKFNFTVFSQAATQVLFSVGIGWGIYETLGANIPKKNNLKSDAILVSICDTGAAILAGFVIIPSAFAGGVDMQSGPSLIFLVMTGIFSKLPGGRLIGICFFLAIVFAVISSLFTFFEISIRTFEDNLKMGRIKATLIISLIIGAGNIIVSLGFGVLSGIKLPWLDASGISYLGLYDWLDTFTGYILLPLGCLLVCLFVSKVWGFEEYEKELTNNGKFGRITLYDKILTYIVVPVFMVIIILNVFGFIR